MTHPAPPPVDRFVDVPLTPAQAFELFTAEMRRWWPFVGHSCSDAAGAEVVFEPWVGGAVTEHAPDGRTYPWGTVIAWNPPRGFAMRWHPGLPAHESTHLEVSFMPHAGGCRVQVVHGGWEARGAGAHDKRDQYDQGWPVVLERLAAAAGP